MPQFNISRTIGPLALCLTLVLSLVACGSSPKVDGDYQPTGALAEQVQQLQAAGDYAGIASLYLSLQGGPREQREWRLLAGEAYIDGNDPQRALDTVIALDSATLGFEQRTRLEMVVARAELLLNGPEAAAMHLPGYSSALPADLGIDVLEIRIQIFAANGRREEELLERLALDKVAGTRPAVQERNRGELWALIQGMPEEELLTLVSLDPDLAGWVALQRAARVPIDDRDAFDEQISNWWARFPNHVAAGRARAIEEARSLPRVASQVALLLPLSGRYSRVGEAIQEGFMTALESDLLQQPRLRVYDTESNDVEMLYELAQSEGAEVIVGPLLKDRVERLAQRQNLDVSVLALNRVALEESPNPAFFQFGLVPEDEAQQIALDSIERGQARALVLYPMERPEPEAESEAESEPEIEADTVTVSETQPEDGDEAILPPARPLTWGERLRDAFVETYTRSAGDIVGIESFSPSGADFTQPITALLQLDSSETRHADLQRRLGRNLEFEPRRREDADIIFLAATSDQARQVYPQLRFYRLGDLPVVATSHVYSGRADPIRDRDLDGLRHLEIPWIADRQQTPLGQYAFPDSASESHTEPVEKPTPSAAELRPRLFAMGADAYHLLPWLTALRVSTGAALNGATGSLSSDADGRIRRRLLWVNFEDGLVVKTEVESLPEVDPSEASPTTASGSSPQ